MDALYRNRYARCGAPGAKHSSPCAIYAFGLNGSEVFTNRPGEQRPRNDEREDAEKRSRIEEGGLTENVKCSDQGAKAAQPSYKAKAAPQSPAARNVGIPLSIPAAQLEPGKCGPPFASNAIGARVHTRPCRAARYLPVPAQGETSRLAPRRRVRRARRPPHDPRNEPPLPTSRPSQRCHPR